MGSIRRKSLRTEFSMNILYLIHISFFTCTNNYMYHLPIILHYLIGIAECLNLIKGTIYECIINNKY